jgi:Ca-activated chloride channel family protein
MTESTHEGAASRRWPIFFLMAFALACQAQAKSGGKGLRPASSVGTTAGSAQKHGVLVHSAVQMPQPLDAAVADGTKSGAATVTHQIELDRTAVMQGGDGILHVAVNLTSGRAVDADARVATDMVVVLDRSGSMSGSKLAYAKAALRELVTRLDDSDRLGIVVYDTSAEVLSPLRHATAEAKRDFLSATDQINVRGNTNLSDGLDLGHRLLDESRRANRPARMLLLSDGLANTGDASPEGLTLRARRAIAREYVISTMGIGADFDEHLMTQLATAGTGAFYYLAKLETLPSFFDAELRTAGATVASNAKLVIYPAAGVKVIDASGVITHSSGNRADVALGSLYAGQARTLWLTLHVPSDHTGPLALGELAFEYRDRGGAVHSKSDALPKIACVAERDEFQRRVNQKTWERAVVEEELSRAEERLGDAIAAGTAADVDREVDKAIEHLSLAKSLGNKKVEQAVRQLEVQARSAKKAQTAAPEVKNHAAKSQKSTGYMNRNKSKYVSADPFTGF